MLGCYTNLLLTICEIHIELLLQLESHLKKKLIFDTRNGRIMLILRFLCSLNLTA